MNPQIGERTDPIINVLHSYSPSDPQEAIDVERLTGAIAASDVWSREAALHITGSALVLHPATRRVLLRWHDRLQAWAQVGGHADDGERDPCAIALREATEETGLSDLVLWPSAYERAPIQIVIVRVPARGAEPAHEHADVRYLLGTNRPDEAVAESKKTPLRWLSLADALRLTSEGNLQVLLQRAKDRLDEEAR